jgi:hypothetical protein
MSCGIDGEILATEVGFLLPCDHRVGFTDSAAFVAGSLQTFVGDFCPKVFQNLGRRLVRVPFSVIRCPRHLIRLLCAPKFDGAPTRGLIFYAIRRCAFDTDQEEFFAALRATSDEMIEQDRPTSVFGTFQTWRP